VQNSWMILLARAVSGQAAISAKAHMTWHMTAPSSQPFGTCGPLHCILAVIRHVKQCCARELVGYRLPTHTTTHSQQLQVSIEPAQMSRLIHASRLTSEAPKCIQAARLPRAWSTRNGVSCDTQDLRPGLAQHETCSHPVHVWRHLTVGST